MIHPDFCEDDLADCKHSTKNIYEMFLSRYRTTYLIFSFVAHNNKQWSLLLLDAIFNQNTNAIVDFLEHHFQFDPRVERTASCMYMWKKTRREHSWQLTRHFHKTGSSVSGVFSKRESQVHFSGEKSEILSKWSRSYRLLLMLENKIRYILTNLMFSPHFDYFFLFFDRWLVG